MTVLQQIKSYYLHLVPGNLTNAVSTKALAERLLTPDGVKTHPTPELYFAGRGQSDLSVEAGANSRLLTEKA